MSWHEVTLPLSSDSNKVGVVFASVTKRPSEDILVSKRVLMNLKYVKGKKVWIIIGWAEEIIFVALIIKRVAKIKLLPLGHLKIYKKDPKTSEDLVLFTKYIC